MEQRKQEREQGGTEDRQMRSRLSRVFQVTGASLTLLLRRTEPYGDSGWARNMA